MKQNETQTKWDASLRRILLVDDEESIRKVLSISLRDSGYQVLTAGSGPAALQIFRDSKPPIVLTDIKMPGVTGVELLKIIKHENPDTEVIMISGHGDMDLAIECLKNDATDFITKPIHDSALEIALKRASERIRMRLQLKEYTDNLEALVEEKSAKLLEAERAMAVTRVVEGLSSAIWAPAGDRESGIRYFNEMPCHVSLHNREMKIVSANKLFQERFGNRIGKGSGEIYRRKDEHQDECPVGRTLRTQKGQRSREVVKGVDGIEIPVIVYTTPIRNREEDIELVLELSADIMEVRQLQEKLRQTEQNYRQLFDEVPCYITVQDRNLTIIAANKRFKEHFDDKEKSHCYHAYKKQAEPCHNCPVTETFRDGKPHHSEMVVTAGNGEQYNLLVSTAPISDSIGNVTQVMEMATDITEIRRLQDQLSSLGLKIGTISHGIKGLLTGLDGGMYTLDLGFSRENQEKIQEGWEIVKLMVQRIRSMILDILYYAKERDLQWEYIDALSFAGDVAFTMEPMMAKHDIDFHYDFHPDTCSFEIDAGVVRSALINLLENAVDACVANKPEKEKKISFRLMPESDRIVFIISDNGIGMDEETKKNLFTLFFSSKENQGTGLGLFIADKIIQQHGGTISVESTPGQGSTFTITLPRKIPEHLKKQDSRKPD
ncbi:MAG: response regulator [Pseudomonadota bacterium]